MKTLKNKGILKIWLWTGLVMVLIQIILGGITRLTGSGLSITRWDLITGIWYPVSETEWNIQFELYKKTPQFAKVNNWMDLERFQFIYFWEYFHRLWARIMGLVFLFPLLFFIVRNYLNRALKIRIAIIFLLAAFVASLGWIMVASGLINYPWVNAYKLAFHLIAAVSLLVYIYLSILFIDEKGIYFNWKKERAIGPLFFCLLLFVQIFFGGIMAGMRAALIAPEWPTLLGSYIPREVFQMANYKTYLFSEYELSHTGPLIIQFFHRTLAYLICILLVFFIYRYYTKFKQHLIFLSVLIGIQILLGILTLLNSHGAIPIWYASLHQLTGIILLLVSIKFLSLFGQNVNKPLPAN